MPTVKDVLHALWTIAPARYKEDWDNIGLLCGRADAPVRRILVALDASRTAAEEAQSRGCELVVTHHPLIFGGLKAATDEDPAGERVLAFAERGIAVISMHTNLDCAPGGVNDVLAAKLGLKNVTVLEDGETAGLIRIGETAPQSAAEFAAQVHRALGCPGLRYVDGGRPVRRVAVGGGACAGFAERVLAAGCDAFVTADLKYHELCDAAQRGLTLIDAGHFQTEDPVCDVLAEKLTAAFPAAEVLRSAAHRDVIRWL